MGYDSTYIMEGTERKIEALEKQTVELYDLAEQISNAEGAIADREASIYLDVCSETDATTGKPRYTNDAQRKAAVQELATSDAILTAMRPELREWKRDAAVRRASIERLRMEVGLNKAYLNGAYAD